MGRYEDSPLFDSGGGEALCLPAGVFPQVDSAADFAYIGELHVGEEQQAGIDFAIDGADGGVAMALEIVNDSGVEIQGLDRWMHPALHHADDLLDHTPDQDRHTEDEAGERQATHREHHAFTNIR